MAGSAAGVPIHFGTSGWRGILGESFTFPRLRAALRGVACWVLEQPAAARQPVRLVVARDTRFLGERMVGMAVAILEGSGVEPIVAPEPVPTPVAAHAVTRRGAAAGVVFTASHNPPEYHGLKVIGPWGGAIREEQARRIEALALGALDEALPDESRPAPAVDLTADYTGELLSHLDLRALGGAPLHVVYDAMHGVGARVLAGALARAGVRVSLRRGEPDPRFGGAAPDPSPERLADLARELRGGEGLRLGLATDGDADRFGAIDADGRMLSEAEGLALLVDQLARTGRLRGGVALSIATGSLVERVATSHGLAVSRHPIGFRHLSQAIAADGAGAAGDESGGFAFAPLGCDKDGILAACLMAEIAAASRAPLGARLAELEARHGRSAWGRTALPAHPHTRDRLEKLLAAPPARADGCAVRAARAGDGLHLELDDGFLMLRASGTEPVLRVYAEAGDPPGLRRRLAAGVALLHSR